MPPEHLNYIEEWGCDLWLSVSALVFTGMTRFQKSYVPEIKEEERVRKHLNKWQAQVRGVPTSNTGVGPCNFEAILSIIKRLWQPG